MKYEWKDLPKPINCFTIRSATMKNLDTGEIIQHYSANTKIVVVQKSVTSKGTFYRTESAKQHRLNYAFGASAFGLPNEIAPSAHTEHIMPNSLIVRQNKSDSHTLPIEKIKTAPTFATPKDGEGERHNRWFNRIFRRKNG